MPGYVHVYTGNGKGKTTAALGLALRAAGAGWRVFIAQFGKGMTSSELESLQRFGDTITVRQFGAPGPVTEARGDLSECIEVLASGDYPLVVLDEATLAPMLEIFSVDDLLTLIDARAENVELVITGRYAHRRIIDRADLVTEMREVKHYYHQGVLARAGIER
ncbi:MAG: cob(I)yrinic acid a,c-diamide adenosyltransferase [Planctomycetes bacterium]|nr:cob(I)yrinic acid a,c-diamide adenosyltransferase [Planctomycetota bacterium]